MYGWISTLDGGFYSWNSPLCTPDQVEFENEMPERCTRRQAADGKRSELGRFDREQGSREQGSKDYGLEESTITVAAGK